MKASIYLHADDDHVVAKGDLLDGFVTLDLFDADGSEFVVYINSAAHARQIRDAVAMLASVLGERENPAVPDRDDMRVMS